MKLLNNSGLSNIYLVEFNRYFDTYTFDTLLGKVRIEKSQQGYCIDYGVSKYLRDKDCRIVHFWCADEAIKKLIELCDIEVTRLSRYII